jgi:prepilin-type N-terminal cleavage/methylation domain-containing protein
MQYRNRGFTMVEVLAAAVLAGIGIVASMGAIGKMQHAEAIGREREALINLAVEKYDEVVATTDLSQANSLSGDFSDRNDSDHTWVASTATVNTTSNTAVVNTATTAAATTVDSLSITVKSNSDPSQTYTVTGLVFIPASTSTGAGPGTAARPTGVTGG